MSIIRLISPARPNRWRADHALDGGEGVQTDLASLPEPAMRKIRGGSVVR